MKNISQKSWFSLSINYNDIKNIDTLYTMFYNYTSGITEEKNRIIFYFESINRAIVNNILNNELKDYRFNFEDIHYQNWHTNFEKNFKPITINDNLMIVPNWYKNMDKDNTDYIKIIPGMAFGTGHHETTQLIIESLIKNLNLNDRVLDLGSGSGILSIAALKFGAAKIMAVEYDEDCKDNFYENMELNNIEDNFTLLIDDVLSFEDYNYDLIIANINKNIIKDLLPQMKKHIKDKVKIILSGLLFEDKKDIMNIISDLEFNVLNQTQKGEWICIVLD